MDAHVARIGAMLDLERPLFGICLGHQLLARALGLETFKLRFGHRGANHPVLERETGRVLVTSQNHGFAVAMPDAPGATSRSPTRRSTTAPSRACGCPTGPSGRCSSTPRPRPGRTTPATPWWRSSSARGRRVAEGRLVPRRDDLRKIALIGSGPIVIGQACEFDYSGVQALRVLREEGYETVLVNSNPATIMTDPGWADRTYIEPLDLEGVSGVLRRERPDALLPTLGGQTALNMAMELDGGRRAGRARDRADRRLRGGHRDGRGPRALRGLHGERRPALRPLRGRALRRRGAAAAGRRRRCGCRS